MLEAFMVTTFLAISVFTAFSLIPKIEENLKDPKRLNWNEPLIKEAYKIYIVAIGIFNFGISASLIFFFTHFIMETTPDEVTQRSWLILLLLLLCVAFTIHHWLTMRRIKIDKFSYLLLKERLLNVSSCFGALLGLTMAFTLAHGFGW